jgi:predicted Zn-dependent protease
MGRSNYDPRQMSEIMRMLDQLSAAEGGGRLPEWQATHPSPANRLQAINAQIATLPQNFSSTIVNRDSYERLLDGLVFGINPRQGYFTGSQFSHPDLRFRFTFPDGWATNNGAQAVVAVSPAQDAVVELSQATEPTADAAARAFLSQQGITSGSSARVSLTGGIPAVRAPFSAATDNGTLRGTVLFAEYGGAVYRIVGYAPEARWSAYQGPAERALLTFQRLTDPAALNIQPQHVDIVTAAGRTTIATLALQRASPVSAARLALINQVEVQTPFESGRTVKWVIGVVQPIP